MPDSRGHRGAHPEDERDFAPSARARLVAAARELSFLLSHAYSPDASLKLVGDHHQLTARQRKAVQRASGARSALRARQLRAVSSAQLAGQRLALDGFNCLITVEAMLGKAPILRSRDHVLRDLSSVHGTYRTVAETERAIALLLATLTRARAAQVEVLLDRPVGNSGRTAALFAQRARELPFPLHVELADRVDPYLANCDAIVATSDSWILDRAARNLDLPARWSPARPSCPFGSSTSRSAIMETGTMMPARATPDGTRATIRNPHIALSVC